MADNAVERRLRELIGHLLASQEEERRRLACALHDDFSQQLALLAIDLEQLRLQPPSSPTELTSRLQELSERTNGISSRVYRLSHELRPAKLEALGLFATVLGYCEEVSGQHGVTVTLTAQGRTDAISAAVALCVYPHHAGSPGHRRPASRRDVGASAPRRRRLPASPDHRGRWRRLRCCDELTRRPWPGQHA